MLVSFVLIRTDRMTRIENIYVYRCKNDIRYVFAITFTCLFSVSFLLVSLLESGYKRQEDNSEKDLSHKVTSAATLLEPFG
jgi:hypothetical protein